MNSIVRFASSLALVVALPVSFYGCGVSVKYGFSGQSTDAKSISITEFYNNADLGPANMGQTFTNDLKNYFLRNSSLSVVAEEGELQLEGEIMEYRLTPIAPTATSDQSRLTQASSTRLTITIKVTYVDTRDDKLSFKNKNFSFYKDFENDQNLADIEENLITQIFERIANDIFNATVANW